jgi:hypothetical protein
MVIIVCCRNGHVLRVKDEYAGKTGFCPHCRCKVEVPPSAPETGERGMSEEEVLAALGTPRQRAGLAFDQPAPKDASRPLEEDVREDSVHDSEESESGISLLGSATARPQQRCAKCGHVMSVAFMHCPRCGDPLPDPHARPKPK